MGATTGIYVALGSAAFAFVFALALARIASRAEGSSERLLAECLRERARALESLAGVTIEARRLHASEAATRLSHRRTWRSPSSA